MYEVENKFSVSDATSLRRRFAEAGAEWSPAEMLVDRYFAHPCRDFRQTDEALRIRSANEQVFITYKGPKIDTATKTRRELELPIGEGIESSTLFAELLTSLGFRLVTEVRKRREYAHLNWQGHQITACWDEVEELGTFVELEATSDQDRLTEIQAVVVSCALSLGLDQPMRKSYLGMLLAKRNDALTASGQC